MIPAPPGQDYIGDVPSTVLPDGRFIFGSKLDRRMWSLDPATLAWTAIPAIGKNDDFAEEGFTQLPGGSVLTVGEMDRFADGGGMVGFRLRDSTVRFEVNLRELKQARLQMSSQIIRLAQRVIEDGG